MTCHDARELFSALVDEALSARERGDLDAHLAGCAECRRELERFQSTVSLLHRVEPARAPAGFVDRVVAAARPAPWYRRLLRAVFLPWPVKLPLEAAALVLVGVTVALLYRGTPELEQAARLETRPPAVSEAPPHPASAPKAAAPEPVVPALQPAAPRFAAPAPSDVPAPMAEKKTAAAESEVASRLKAKSEPVPRVADKRDAQESRDTLGKREERGNFRDEADATRRQDAAKAAPPPAAPAPAAPTPAAPGEKKAAEAPGGIVVGRARPSVKESAGTDVAAQRLSAARVAPAALDVTGRLSVADRDAALRALDDLVAKAGGREVARRALPDGLAIELAIPRAAWPEFARGLARLGRFTPEREAAELPDDVRVSLRLTD